MRRIFLFAVIAVLCSNESFAQRTIGARRFQLDDGAGHLIKIDNRNGAIGIGDAAALADSSAVLDLSSSTRGLLLPRLSNTQRGLITLPATGLIIYNTDLGTLQFNFGTPIVPAWDTVITNHNHVGLMGSALPTSNIWVGDVTGSAQPMSSLPNRILMTDANGKPFWSSAIPSNAMISANNITSGTLQPGVAITVGNGASITPSGTGTITANMLSGSGPGKYSGKVAIPTNADFLNVSYTGIVAGSSITLTIYDSQAQLFGFVDAKVFSITPGTGFRATFSASYPPSNTGELHYTVINP